MKKFLIIIIVMILFISGCSFKKENPYSDYEHYDLSDKDIYTYNFYNYIDEYPGYINDEYAIADITPVPYECDKEGLFYKVSNNDYILLDEIESSDGADLFDNEKYTFFFQYQNENRLIILRNMRAQNTEYILSKEKIEKHELKFDTSKVSSYYLEIGPVLDKDDNYLYLSASTVSSTNKKSYKIKCTLKDYVCETYEKE